jgi:DNA replication protein DnaC
MTFRTISNDIHNLWEIIEERSIDKSIAFTSQLPVSHWSEVISDTVIFDAIRDRLEHSALTVNITGPTYRGVKARKLASKKKVA